MFGWTDYFSSFKIYPNLKTHHIHAIKDALGIKDFSKILFFDDKAKNIGHTDKLGVFPYLLGSSGLTLSAICEGLTQFDQKQKLDRTVQGCLLI